MSRRVWILISCLVCAVLLLWFGMPEKESAAGGDQQGQAASAPESMGPVQAGGSVVPGGPGGEPPRRPQFPADQRAERESQSPEERKPWWEDPVQVARLREIYLPDFEQRLQKLAVARVTDQGLLKLSEAEVEETFQQLLGNDEEFGLLNSRLVRGNFPAFVGDLALWLADTLEIQRRNYQRWSDKVGSRAFPEEEYQLAPWEFPPDVHLDRISPDGAWRGDPELLEELALYQVDYLNRIVPVLSERQELLNAVGSAAVKHGLRLLFAPGEMKEFIPEAADQRARLDAALEAFLLQAREAMRRRGLPVQEP